jgi:CobQ-like glutamine amidotransferase family enzyme
LLPRNPELADLLLGWALGSELSPLATEFAERARQERIAEAREVARRKRGLLAHLR